MLIFTFFQKVAQNLCLRLFKNLALYSIQQFQLIVKILDIIVCTVGFRKFWF